jgi:hypothetical protein
MFEHTNLLLVTLPVSLQFLHGGWFLVHIIAIAMIGYLGYKFGRMKET